MAKPVTDEKLETIANMLETARAIVEALECGETVEVESDADAAIAEALELAAKLPEVARD